MKSYTYDYKIIISGSGRVNVPDDYEIEEVNYCIDDAVFHDLEFNDYPTNEYDFYNVEEVD